MAAVIFLLAALMPVAMGASDSGCLNATLPGILGLGTCVGSSLNLCSGTVEDIVAALLKLVQCLITELTSINAVGAVSALLDIVTLVLGALRFDVTTLTNLVKPLCAVANVPGCTTLLTASKTCSQPIPITLPGNLNLVQCLNNTLLLCQNGAPATDILLANLVKAIACLLNTLLGSNPGSLINGLACAVAGLLQSAANANIALQVGLVDLAANIRLSVQYC